MVRGVGSTGSFSWPGLGANWPASPFPVASQRVKCLPPHTSITGAPGGRCRARAGRTMSVRQGNMFLQATSIRLRLVRRGVRGKKGTLSEKKSLATSGAPCPAHRPRSVGWAEERLMMAGRAAEQPSVCSVTVLHCPPARPPALVSQRSVRDKTFVFPQKENPPTRGAGGVTK